MRHIALVTARAARGTDADMPLLLDAFATAGNQATEVAWDDAGIDWSQFDAAVLRSTWDYTRRLPEFLAWAERASAHTRLLNPLAVIRWNTDKHYLAELARADVPVVPTHFIEPVGDADAALQAALATHPGARDFVVKPAVGAGSRDAQRHACTQVAAMRAHIQRLLDARRSVLLQPYLERVDDAGETALLFFDGAFSHAIRKGPLLRRGADATAELYAREDITPRAPTADELDVARRALAALPAFAHDLPYARVDLIRAADGSPVLLELELVEPSVFVGYADGAAMRFVTAIQRRLRAA